MMIPMQVLLTSRSHTLAKEHACFTIFPLCDTLYYPYVIHVSLYIGLISNIAKPCFGIFSYEVSGA